MTTYPVFFAITLVTVMTPGPGVLMTLTNALRHGPMGAFAGITGIAAGTVLVAIASAGSLGVLLSTSAPAFSFLKYAGAAYLLYLGVRLWRSPRLEFKAGPAVTLRWPRLFIDGLLLQLCNPKAALFFLSIFPLFIDQRGHYISQFLLLVTTYSSTVIVIHLLYAYLATFFINWFNSESGKNRVGKLGGGMFFGLGIGLALLSGPPT